MIRFLVMDVDGTLTDGKIYMGGQGELVKAFDVKDGYGIKEILPLHNITPVIITARSSEILQNRCSELGITELYQNTRDKFACLMTLLERNCSTLAEVAYIGDDCLDLQCMEPVLRAGGRTGCPADAVPAVMDASCYVSPHKAGDGAVRDFIEYLVRQTNEDHDSLLKQRLDKAVDYIDNLDFDSLSLGTHEVSPDFYFNVMEYVPSPEEKVRYESHRKYIDIQRLFEGEERMMVADTSMLSPATRYDADKDCLLYENSTSLSGLLFRPGSCLVLFPNNAHKAVRNGDNGQKVKKIVGKLMINYG